MLGTPIRTHPHPTLIKPKAGPVSHPIPYPGYACKELYCLYCTFRANLSLVCRFCSLVFSESLCFGLTKKTTTQSDPVSLPRPTCPQPSQNGLFVLLLLLPYPLPTLLLLLLLLPPPPPLTLPACYRCPPIFRSFAFSSVAHHLAPVWFRLAFTSKSTYLTAQSPAASRFDHTAST